MSISTATSQTSIGIPNSMEQARHDFPTLGSQEIYLDSAATSLSPRPVIEALVEYYLKYRPWIVGVVMAMGALLDARKVAETMSHRITRMNHGQGLTANLVTSMLVIFASKWGMPVSTTHVSCGSLFAIGVASGSAQWRTMAQIALAWVVTLPIAASFAFLVCTIAKLVLV